MIKEKKQTLENNLKEVLENNLRKKELKNLILERS